MIIVQIINGFGNQFFQYATARQLSLKLGMKVKLDLTAFGRIDNTWKFQLDYFPCDFEIANTKELYSLADPYIYHTPGFGFTKLLNDENYRSETHFLERTTIYDPAIEQIDQASYLEGYFQSEKYIEKARAELLEEFAQPIKGDLDNALLDEINSTNAIAVHVRRGDYASVPQINKAYGVCPVSYYRDAAKYLTERIDQPKFFVFSNDIEWCQENLDLKAPVHYISGSNAPPIDFYLMSRCNHFITANSTFSWCAAWLGNRDGKIVVQPTKYFADFQFMFPGMQEPNLSVKEWIRL